MCFCGPSSFLHESESLLIIAIQHRLLIDLNGEVVHESFPPDELGPSERKGQPDMLLARLRLVRGSCPINHAL